MASKYLQPKEVRRLLNKGEPVPEKSSHQNVLKDTYIVMKIVKDKVHFVIHIILCFTVVCKKWVWSSF